VLVLQQQLIHDPQAPAGPLPLWDTPWHHPAWRQRQLAALMDPGSLDQHGQLPAARKRTGDLGPDLAADIAAPEPGERVWSGWLQQNAAGRTTLRPQSGASGDGPADGWPLITLEPAMHHWLAAAGEGPVRLVGSANPWGPWLRVSRLAEGQA